MGDSDPDPDDQPDSPGSPGSPGQPDPIRREAERLVATALGAIQLAGAGLGAGTDAPSAAECAFCPFCRAVATLRDPNPELAERLATAAGDVATGLAGLLRVFSTATAARPPGGTPAGRPEAGNPPEPGTGPEGNSRSPDEVWRDATRTRHDSWPVPERGAPVTASVADPEARPAGAVPPADAAGCARVPQPSVPPEPAGTEPVGSDAVRPRVPASHAWHPAAGAADDDPGRRD